jgi:hypothetical protein
MTMTDQSKFRYDDQPAKDVIGIRAQVHPLDVKRNDQPKFPQGLFEQREWDIGRDFESLVEIGRGKYVCLFLDMLDLMNTYSHVVNHHVTQGYHDLQRLL